jgi:Uma2 family endonuclease
MASVLAPAAPPPFGPHRWTVEEFDRLPNDLFPEGEHVELIDGLIYTKMPQGLPHMTALRAVFAALMRAYGEDHTVSMQIPVVLDEGSKPEPDLSVLRGSFERYDMRYPDPATEIALVVEVSDSSLAFDLGPKQAMYAAAGVPEYWILAVGERALQVCRSPEGGAYRDTSVFREGERVTANGREIDVAALLPRAVAES